MTDIVERLRDHVMCHTGHECVLCTAAGEIDRLRAEVERYKELMVFIDGEGQRAKAIHALEDDEVRELCERIGYGAVMDSAARQWFLKDSVGAFTVGPRAVMIRNIARAALEDGKRNGPADKLKDRTTGLKNNEKRI